MMFFLVFYHIRHFTLLCLPKGCLLRSNRLSLKKSLEKATEDIKATLERAALESEGILDVLTRHAVLVQSKLKAPRRIQLASPSPPR